MVSPKRLDDCLAVWAEADPGRTCIALTISRIADVCAEISALVAKGALAGELGAATGKKSGVDPQKKLDLIANDRIAEALRSAPAQTPAWQAWAPACGPPGARRLQWAARQALPRPVR